MRRHEKRERGAFRSVRTLIIAAFTLVASGFAAAEQPSAPRAVAEGLSVADAQRSVAPIARAHRAGDLNGDGVLDSADLALLLDALGRARDGSLSVGTLAFRRADLNRDGRLDEADIAALVESMAGRGTLLPPFYDPCIEMPWLPECQDEGGGSGGLGDGGGGIPGGDGGSGGGGGGGGAPSGSDGPPVSGSNCNSSCPYTVEIIGPNFIGAGLTASFGLSWTAPPGATWCYTCPEWGAWSYQWSVVGGQGLVENTNTPWWIKSNGTPGTVTVRFECGWANGPSWSATKSYRSSRISR